jgi:hypothetical protein
VRNRTPETEKKNQKFKRNATGVDKNRILETEMGYECHPETDQSTIARERLEERLPNRKIRTQVRGATCTERRRKARKQIQSGFGIHNTDAPGTGGISFCGEDRVLYRLRRHRTRFAASEYVLDSMCGKDDTRPLPTQLPGHAIAIGLAWWLHLYSDRSHPRYSRCPSSTCAHLEKHLLHFHILPDLTVLTALFHRAPVRDQDSYALGCRLPAYLGLL